MKAFREERSLRVLPGQYYDAQTHGMDHDLTELKAAQCLVFASLLARRVDEAILRKSNGGQKIDS